MDGGEPVLGLLPLTRRTSCVLLWLSDLPSFRRRDGLPLGLALGEVAGEVVGGGIANVSGSACQQQAVDKGQKASHAGTSSEREANIERLAKDVRREDRVACAREREETMREAEREGMVGAGGWLLVAVALLERERGGFKVSTDLEGGEKTVLQPTYEAAR